MKSKQVNADADPNEYESEQPRWINRFGEDEHAQQELNGRANKLMQADR